MKSTITSLTVLEIAMMTLITGACTGNYHFRMNGENLVRQERSVSGFNALEISGAIEVNLTQGNKESLVIEADSDYIDKIVTEVQGKTLKIYPERNCCKNMLIL